MLEKNDGATKNGQLRGTDDIVHTRIESPEAQTTLDTQEWTAQRHRRHWTHKNGQLRGTHDIGHTRHTVWNKRW